jgi:hypothetical protein
MGRIADTKIMKGTYLKISDSIMEDIIRVTNVKSRFIRGRVLKSKNYGDIGKLYRYVEGINNFTIIKKKDIMVELL